jgi:hypothetical protein
MDGFLRGSRQNGSSSRRRSPSRIIVTSVARTLAPYASIRFAHGDDPTCPQRGNACGFSWTRNLLTSSTVTS